MLRRAPICCFILLAASVGLFALWLKAEIHLHRIKQEVRYTRDAPLERRAYAVKARSDRAMVKEIEDLLFPVTVSFPGRQCVELRPRWNARGGTSISCFSNGTGKLLSHANIGQ